jgi:hypothetical protein
MLTSGGDGQLVSCALELGYGVGRARELKLNHLISADKATMPYLTKMDYGIYYSNEWFFKECFPENLKPITEWKALRLISGALFLNGLKTVIRGNYKKFSMHLAGTAGMIDGNLAAFNRKSPAWLKWLSKRYS